MGSGFFFFFCRGSCLDDESILKSVPVILCNSVIVLEVSKCYGM